MQEKTRKPKMKPTYLMFALLVGAAAVVVSLKSHVNFPHTAATTNSNLTTNPLSLADLRHGDLQVQLMIDDRPAMASYVRKGDEIWEWVARQFAGEGLGEPVYWDPDPPSDTLGMNRFRANRHTIRIALDDNGVPLTGEQLWAVAVFELCNTHIRRQWASSDADAKSGKISKREWIRNAQKLEFTSAKAVKTFYFSLWKPHLTKLGITQNSTVLKMWRVDLPDSFEEFLKQSSSYSDYVRELEDTFDTQVAPKINHP